MANNKTKPHLYYLHALTPLHVGTGRGEGFIDLPLLREQATGLPCVPGSAVKGVLRYEHVPPKPEDALPDAEKEAVNKKRQAGNALFGKESAPGDGGNESSGLLRVGDARLLCLPVRSWQGAFAWAACPFVLRRYLGDLQDADMAGRPAKVPRIDKEDEVLAEDSALVWGGDKIYLEDLSLRVRSEQLAKEWAAHLANQLFADEEWRQEFIKRFVILPDTLFAFLAKHGTELRPHVRLNNANRTVEEGPWHEESLPAESLLWGIMGMDVFRWNKTVDDEMTALWGRIKKPERLQIGGGATTGLGQVRWVCPS
jgi:CRISPR-associated protein Cmr4